MHRTFILASLVGMLAAADLDPAVEYRVVQLNGAAVVAGEDLRQPTLQLDAAAHRVSGCAGINRFGGGFAMQAGTITFSQLFSTMMGGPPEAMQTEQAVLQVLSVPLTITVVDKGFQLSGSKGTLRLAKP